MTQLEFKGPKGEIILFFVDGPNLCLDAKEAPYRIAFDKANATELLKGLRLLVKSLPEKP